MTSIARGQGSGCRRSEVAAPQRKRGAGCTLQRRAGATIGGAQTLTGRKVLASVAFSEPFISYRTREPCPCVRLREERDRSEQVTVGSTGVEYIGS